MADSDQDARSYYLGILQRSEEDWQAAEAALPELRAAWEQIPKDDLNTLWAWVTAASTFFKRRGFRADQTAWVETVLTAAQRAGDRHKEAWCENELGQIQLSLGRLDEAMSRLEKSLALFREVGNRAGEAVLLNSIGGVYQKRGRFDQALEYYDQSLPVYREVDNSRGEHTVLGNIGLIHYKRRALDEALNYFEQALVIIRKLDDRLHEASTLLFVGEIYERTDRLSEAKEAWGQSMSLYESMSMPEHAESMKYRLLWVDLRLRWKRVVNRVRSLLRLQDDTKV